MLGRSREGTRRLSEEREAKKVGRGPHLVQQADWNRSVDTKEKVTSEGPNSWVEKYRRPAKAKANSRAFCKPHRRLQLIPEDVVHEVEEAGDISVDAGCSHWNVTTWYSTMV